jgi:hypothetical protein
VAGTEDAAWIEIYHLDIDGKTFGERWGFLTAPLLADVPVLAFRLWGGASRCVADLGLLGRAPQLAGLRGLYFSATNPGVRGIRGLIEGGGLESLQVFGPGSSDLGPEEAATLAGWPRLAQLRSFSPGYNPLGDEGVTTLANAPLTNLRDLCLSGSGCGDAGATALARAPLSNLTHLYLADNVIRARGVTALAGSAHLANLTHFDVSTPELDEGAAGDEGASALAASPYLGNLTWLALGGNGVGDAGAEALARSRRLTGLRRLYLDSNQIRDRGGRALAASPNLDGIEVLDLRDNPLSERARRALVGRFGERVFLDD